MVGLDMLRSINEPTVAAPAYGLDKKGARDRVRRSRGRYSAADVGSSAAEANRG